jgi:hypothetical protein
MAQNKNGPGTKWPKAKNGPGMLLFSLSSLFAPLPSHYFSTAIVFYFVYGVPEYIF